MIIPAIQQALSLVDTLVSRIKEKDTADFASTLAAADAAQLQSTATAPATSDSLAATPLFKYGQGDTITLEDLNLEAADAIKCFRTGFNRLMQENGIDMSKPVELVGTFDGSLRVTNDHPDKERIEEILAANPDVVNQFHRVDATLSIVKAGEEAAAFQRAYARDPQAAVAQYSYLFDRSHTDIFSLLMQPTEDGAYSAEPRISRQWGTASA